MTYRFLPPAAREVREPARCYEERVPGLGFEFISEVRAAIRRILANPEAWCPLDAEFSGGAELTDSLTASSMPLKAPTSSLSRSCTSTGIRKPGVRTFERLAWSKMKPRPKTPPSFARCLVEIASRQQQTRRTLLHRLRVELAIAKPSNKLLAHDFPPALSFPGNQRPEVDA